MQQTKTVVDDPKLVAEFLVWELANKKIALENSKIRAEHRKVLNTAYTLKLIPTPSPRLTPRLPRPSHFGSHGTTLYLTTDQKRMALLRGRTPAQWVTILGAIPDSHEKDLAARL